MIVAGNWPTDGRLQFWIRNLLNNQDQSVNVMSLTARSSSKLFRAFQMLNVETFRVYGAVIGSKAELAV